MGVTQYKNNANAKPSISEPTPLNGNPQAAIWEPGPPFGNPRAAIRVSAGRPSGTGWPSRPANGNPRFKDCSLAAVAFGSPPGRAFAKPVEAEAEIMTEWCRIVLTYPT